jgi:hypothetical protein
MEKEESMRGASPLNVGSWLRTDMERPEIEVRFAPSNGHFRSLG